MTDLNCGDFTGLNCREGCVGGHGLVNSESSDPRWPHVSLSEMASVPDLKAKFLECHICLETYRRPKTIPCLHSFCEDCLNNYISHCTQRQAAVFPCPVCKTMVTCPDPSLPTSQWGSTFKASFFLNDLADCLKRASLASPSDASPSPITAPCSLCDKRQAEHFCVDCEHKLCPSCQAVHARIPTSSSHQVVDYSRSCGSLVHRRRKRMCPTHGDRVLDMYCPQCRQVLCQMCHLTVHKLCPGVGPLEDVAHRRRAWLREMEACSEGHMDTLSAASQHLGTTLEAAHLAQVSDVERLKEFFIKTMHALRTKQDELMRQLENTYHTQCASLMEAKRDREELFTALSNARELTHSLLEVGTDWEVTQEADCSLGQQLQDLFRRVDCLPCLQSPPLSSVSLEGESARGLARYLRQLSLSVVMASPVTASTSASPFTTTTTTPTSSAIMPVKSTVPNTVPTSPSTPTPITPTIPTSRVFGSVTPTSTNATHTFPNTSSMILSTSSIPTPASPTSVNALTTATPSNLFSRRLALPISTPISPTTPSLATTPTIPTLPVSPVTPNITPRASALSTTAPTTPTNPLPTTSANTLPVTFLPRLPCPTTPTIMDPPTWGLAPSSQSRTTHPSSSHPSTHHPPTFTNAHLPTSPTSPTPNAWDSPARGMPPCSFASVSQKRMTPDIFPPTTTHLPTSPTTPTGGSATWLSSPTSQHRRWSPSLVQRVKTRTGLDTQKPDIVDLAVVGGGQLLLVDWANSCVKGMLMGPSAHTVCRLELPSPLRVCTLSNHQVAVSAHDRKLYVISVLERLETRHWVITQRPYWGLAKVKDGTLAASCRDPGEVHIIDLQGHVLRTLTSDPSDPGTPLFQCPGHIAATTRGEITVTDSGKCAIYRLTTEGHVRFKLPFRGQPDLDSTHGVSCWGSEDRQAGMESSSQPGCRGPDDSSSPPGLSSAQGLSHYGPEDSLLVADCASGRVLRVSRCGKVVDTLLSPLHGLDSPAALAVGPGDAVYVSSQSPQHPQSMDVLVFSFTET